MATDPSQAAGPSTVLAASEQVQAPAAAFQIVPAGSVAAASVPSAVLHGVPQRIEGTDYAYFQALYDRIPVAYEDNTNLRQYAQSALAPYPVVPYTTSLSEAEHHMCMIMEYCMTYNIRHENMPPSWGVLLTRVNHNIRSLGGSYNLQVADNLGRIPRHPAEEAAAKAAAAQSADTAAGLKTPGEKVVLEPSLGTGTDLTVALTPQPPAPETLVQRELATPSDKAKALPDSGFPLLARPESLRSQSEIREVVAAPAQFKFTEPRKLSQEWILEVKEKPNVIRVYIKLIFAHLTNIRAYRQGDSFPIQFLNYVSDSKLMESLHSFVEAEAALKGQTEEELIEKTVTLIKRLLTGNSRDPAIVAKETLLSGKISQGTVSVSQYIETFKSHTRLVKDHTSPAVQEWLCTLFRSGIKPSLVGQCALTDQGKEWETLESLFDHAIKEETKLLAKDRVTLTDVSPPFSAKRGPTLAAMPAQMSHRPRLDKQRLQPPPNRGNNSDRYIVPNFPRKAKYKPWSKEVMDLCIQNKTCFKCRDRVHPKGHEDCPYRLSNKQAWGDYSPLHGQDPEAMQVDDPQASDYPQKPAKESPYAPKNAQKWKSHRGSPSASAHKKRFSK